MNTLQVDKTLKQLYDDYHDGPCELPLGAADKAANIISACHTCPHDIVLDIGTGDGSVLQQLARLRFAKQLYGLEISQSAIDAVRSRDIASLKDVQMFDGYSIPYDDDQFDLAILSHVVEHLEYPRRLLCEAGRVAKNVFVEVPLEDTVRAPREFRPLPCGHINFYSYRNIRKLLQTCGFEIISQGTTNVSYAAQKYSSGKMTPLVYAIREVAHRIVSGLARTIFTYHCYLLARKRNGIHRF